jgi:excisionase family DNA binding protein
MKRKRTPKTARPRAPPTSCEVPPEPVRPRLMAFKEACLYGGFGRWKAYSLIREGKLTAYRMGKKTMIEVASIDRYHASLPKIGETPAPGGLVRCG